MLIKTLFKICGACALVTSAHITYAQEKASYPQVTTSSNKLISEDTSGVNVAKGDQLLIEIKTSDGGDPRNDTHMLISLVFTIPEHSDTFKLTNFKENKAYLVIAGCRCMDLGYNTVVNGEITGKKDDKGLWHINADVTAIGKDSGESKIFRYKTEY